jgi:hypothetical protein
MRYTAFRHMKKLNVAVAESDIQSTTKFDLPTSHPSLLFSARFYTLR